MDTILMTVYNHVLTLGYVAIVSYNVLCLGHGSTILYTAPSVCSEGAVRLMDGVIQQEGRIEVCSNGVWGSVCDQAWDKTDAHIVCQELGYGEIGKEQLHVLFSSGGGSCDLSKDHKFTHRQRTL